MPLCRVPPAFCCSVSIHPSAYAESQRNVFAAVNCAELSLKFKVPERRGERRGEERREGGRAIQTIYEPLDVLKEGVS